jgi:hypothetical protein
MCVQVAEMQKKVACVWRWFTWKEPYGRAGDGVLCSLRRKLAGWDVLKPSIDWETCTLLCDVSNFLIPLDSEQYYNDNNMYMS